MNFSSFVVTEVIARIAPDEIARRIAAGPGFTVGPDDPSVWQLQKTVDHGDGSGLIRRSSPAG